MLLGLIIAVFAVLWGFALRQAWKEIRGSVRNFPPIRDEYCNRICPGCLRNTLEYDSSSDVFLCGCGFDSRTRYNEPLEIGDWNLPLTRAFECIVPDCHGDMVRDSVNDTYRCSRCTFQASGTAMRKIYANFYQPDFLRDATL